MNDLNKTFLVQVYRILFLSKALSQSQDNGKACSAAKHLSADGFLHTEVLKNEAEK